MKLKITEGYYENLVEDIYMNREQYEESPKDMRCDQMLQDGAVVAAELSDLFDDPNAQEAINIFGKMMLIIAGRGYNGYDILDDFYEGWYNQIIKTGLDRKFAQFVGLDESIFDNYKDTIKQLEKGNWHFYEEYDDEVEEEDNEDDPYEDGEILFMGQYDDEE